MRAPLSLTLFGLAAMIGPMLGTSMPWAPAVHALAFGTETWGWWRGAPHMLPAYLAMNAGLVIAWVGVTWACVEVALHERMFVEEQARRRERARW